VMTRSNWLCRPWSKDPLKSARTCMALDQSRKSSKYSETHLTRQSWAGFSPCNSFSCLTTSMGIMWFRRFYTSGATKTSSSSMTWWLPIVARLHATSMAVALCRSV
jgi:hypothetical protein